MPTKVQMVVATLQTYDATEFAIFTPAGCFVGTPCLDNVDENDLTLTLSNVSIAQ